MTKKLLYVANWKMNMSFKKGYSFFCDNKNELEICANNQEVEKFIICPSFLVLGALALSTQKSIFWGAQNCSEHSSGAYTGEIDALSLWQAGASHCIVGHSERRLFFGETDIIIGQKIKQLFAHNIIPIVCIGETEKEQRDGVTKEVLYKQLQYVLTVCSEVKQPVIFAYEPVWAIGSGIMPTTEYVEKVLILIINYVKERIPALYSRFIYGGSITPTTVAAFKKIPLIDGFLIGGASIDFKQLKDIITTEN